MFNPYRLIMAFLNISRLSYIIPDKLYLVLLYSRLLGIIPNLKNPVTFSEKLNWLKLYDRNPLYTEMVDKHKVKKYVADIIGEKYIIPTFGTWETFEDIDFNKLPRQFVLKCNHDSGGIVICKNKQIFNYSEAERKISLSLRTNYYHAGREWPYKYVKPKVIAEKFMIEDNNSDLKDYKIFNFNGRPSLIKVDFDRFVNHRRNFYTVDWDFVDMEILYKNSPGNVIDKPVKLNEMLELSEKLAKNIPFCRIDFYLIKNEIYFGEITFFPEGGFLKIYPNELDKKFGDLLNLPVMYKN